MVQRMLVDVHKLLALHLEYKYFMCTINHRNCKSRKYNRWQFWI